MVCATITRDPNRLDDERTIKIRDVLHDAIARFFFVNKEDVEIRVREVGRLDINCGPLAIDVVCGPGKKNSRLKVCRPILFALDEALQEVVPKEFHRKGQSNLWLLMSAKGASMPIGCSDLVH